MSGRVWCAKRGDYQLSEHVCLICEHGPHRQAACQKCGCTTWINTAVASGKSLVGINNILMENIPRISMMLADILELLVETNPEAVAVIDARREERRKEYEAQKASQQQGPAPDQEGQDAGTSSPDSGEDIQGEAV